MSKTHDHTDGGIDQEEIETAIKKFAEKAIELQREEPDGNLIVEADLGDAPEPVGVRVQYGLAATLEEYYDEKEIKVAYVDGYVVGSNDLFEVAKLHSPDAAVQMHNYLLENAVSGETALNILNQGDL